MQQINPLGLLDKSFTHALFNRWNRFLNMENCECQIKNFSLINIGKSLQPSEVKSLSYKLRQQVGQSDVTLECQHCISHLWLLTWAFCHCRRQEAVVMPLVTRSWPPDWAAFCSFSCSHLFIWRKWTRRWELVLGLLFFLCPSIYVFLHLWFSTRMK